MFGKLASSTRNHGNNVGTIENNKIYPTRLNFEFQLQRNIIKHCLQSRLLAITYFFQKCAISDLPKGPISIYGGAPNGGSCDSCHKNRFFVKLKFAASKKDYGMTMISNYTTHMTLEYIKIQNTLVIGAKGGGKLSPFVLTAVR